MRCNRTRTIPNTCFCCGLTVCIGLRTGKKKSGQEVEAFLLAERLRSVKFTFRDQNGEEQESWDTTTTDEDPTKKRRLPAAVSCRLEFWLDDEQETSISFQTTVLLPVGLIRPAEQDDAA
jgi:hypothetical protein